MRRACSHPSPRSDDVLTDWKRLPENGWSLFGLAESLRVRGKKDEAAAAQAKFAAVWRAADTPIKSSCLCQPGVELP